ncbi:hypothetical protein [Streptomyces sp. NBC_00057]|uniref:hypothetical protein n=1 Tax=Streptomyces sp. NBC_00057 TaxID=2975634 RepID=UPI003255F7F7
MTDVERRKSNVTYSAPVGSVDLAAFQDDGTPYEIWACDDCLPWHAEVVRVEREILVREWHAVDCPQFQDLVADSGRDSSADRTSCPAPAGYILAIAAAQREAVGQ